jgi:hypothetical protein
MSFVRVADVHKHRSAFSLTRALGWARPAALYDCDGGHDVRIESVGAGGRT